MMKPYSRTALVFIMSLLLASCHNNSGTNKEKSTDIYYEEDTSWIAPSTNTHLVDTASNPAQKTEKMLPTDNATSVRTVNRYYDAGYDAGYEDGYNDGIENVRKDSYDDDCRYRGWKSEEYQLGYDEGYDAGFDDGYADNGGDPDKEE